MPIQQYKQGDGYNIYEPTGQMYVQPQQIQSYSGEYITNPQFNGDAMNNNYWYNWSNNEYMGVPQDTQVQPMQVEPQVDYNVIPQISNQDIAYNYNTPYFNNVGRMAGEWGNTQDRILGWYNQLANDVNNRSMQTIGMSENLANQLSNDILSNRDYIYSMYGPDGEITNQVNQYYSGLINNVAGDTGRQLAQADVNARDGGASANMLRAQQNDIANAGYQRSLQAMAQDIDAKNKIAENLQNYLTALRQEYGNTQNEYVIKRYEEANNLLNNIESSVAEQMNNMELTKLQFDQQRALQAMQMAAAGGGASSGTSQEDLNKMVQQFLTDEQMKVVGGRLGFGTDSTKWTPEQIKTIQSNINDSDLYIAVSQPNVYEQLKGLGFDVDNMRGFTGFVNNNSGYINNIMSGGSINPSALSGLTYSGGNIVLPTK